MDSDGINRGESTVPYQRWRGYLANQVFRRNRDPRRASPQDQVQQPATRFKARGVPGIRRQAAERAREPLMRREGVRQHADLALMFRNMHHKYIKKTLDNAENPRFAGGFLWR